MNRREYLQWLAASTTLAAGSYAVGVHGLFKSNSSVTSVTLPNSTFSVIPVVGDGKWIWRDPPSDARGYLEPREFEVRVRITCEAREETTKLRAATVVPVAFPEQEIISSEIATKGCEAQLVQLGETAAQLMLFAPRLLGGQLVAAELQQKIKLCKSYHGYEGASFPREQKLSREIANSYLRSSPGIEINYRPLKDLVKDLTSRTSSPWAKAQAFYQWAWENIEARLGDYTSVEDALKDRVGDCEERAAVFIAMCRASGIPARLVWVPNHAWAEFYLLDAEGTGHWIPAHTAAYSWFGWTGAHELVLQKGDRIAVPQSSRPTRLIADWYQFSGAAPTVTFTAELNPLGETPELAGPGSRTKTAKGKWTVVARNEDDRLMRE
ncbi:MAG: transglutaminase-like domain-containing protein [Pirellulaceae bacterium]